MFGLIAAIFFRWVENYEIGISAIVLILCSLPVFIAGILEDVTKKVGIKIRLLASLISAISAGYYLNAWLTSVQIFGIDNLMTAYPILAVGLTCIAVSGVANSFNIIDGYNGLSGMVGSLILGGIAYVAFQLHDYFIMISALAMIGAILGFLVWNYPAGRIFMGDGGCYLVGFWIAELSILLTARHPEVSKWFPLLLCIYPVFETIFSFYRRLFVKNAHPCKPDALHLHQLIYGRLIRCPKGISVMNFRGYKNPMTSPYLWLLSLMGIIPALLFWKDHILLKVFTLSFCFFYVWIYTRISQFKTPKALIINGH
jgi:UDP-N-acetylmuramyl pentapeptide phosphotransferase/UDP-N-acetylglucosamine-1-phosphate transferase